MNAGNEQNKNKQDQRAKAGSGAADNGDDDEQDVDMENRQTKNQDNQNEEVKDKEQKEQEDLKQNEDITQEESEEKKGEDDKKGPAPSPNLKFWTYAMREPDNMFKLYYHRLGYNHAMFTDFVSVVNRELISLQFQTWRSSHNFTFFMGYAELNKIDGYITITKNNEKLQAQNTDLQRQLDVKTHQLAQLYQQFNKVQQCILEAQGQTIEPRKLKLEKKIKKEHRIKLERKGGDDEDEESSSDSDEDEESSSDSDEGEDENENENENQNDDDDEESETDMQLID